MFRSRWTDRRRMFEASDTPCSALCCNCLQFSCCHPPEITVKTVEATTTTTSAASAGQTNPPIHVVVKNTFSHDDDEEKNEETLEETLSFGRESKEKKTLPSSTRRRRALQFSNWVRDLYNLNDSIRVRDLILVGSHDAASYTIHPLKLFSAVARTQSYSILQQLQSGIRFLDLRIASSEEGNDISIWHGCVMGAKFHKVLDEIRTFITQHPEELIILYIVPEFGKFFSSAQRLHALDIIQQTLLPVGPPNDKTNNNNNNDLQQQEEQVLVNHLFHGDHLLDMLQHWTLRDLYQNMGRTQRVVVLIHDRFFQQLHDTTPCKNIYESQRPVFVGGVLTVSDIQSRYGYCRAETYLRNVWHDSRNLQDLLESALVDVQQHGHNSTTPSPNSTISTSCQFHVSQLLATPGVSSACDVVQALIGRNSLRPISWAYRLYHKDTTQTSDEEEDTICILDNFLRANIDQPWNLFLLDYINQCPWTIQFLTSLNFPVQLTIQMATYRLDSQPPRTMDITELVQSFVCRRRVLYLTNLIRDLNLSNTVGGTITVSYQLSSSPSTPSASIRTPTTPFSSPPTNTTSISQATSWSSSSSFEMDPQVQHHSGTSSGYFASKDSEDTSSSGNNNNADDDNIPKKKKTSNKTLIHSQFVLTFRIKNSMFEAEYSSPNFYFMLLLSHFGCFCTPEMQSTIQIATIPPDANTSS